MCELIIDNQTIQNKIYTTRGVQVMLDRDLAGIYGVETRAQAGQSKADFIAKMSIASKEARESKYWIDLLIATGYLDITEIYVKSLISEIEEIVKLLTSIIKSSRVSK